MEIETRFCRRTYAKLMVSSVLHSSTFYLIIALDSAALLASLWIRGLLPYGVISLSVTLLYYALWVLHALWSSRHAEWFLLRKFTFTDEDVRVKTPGEEKVIQWEAFESWRDNSGHYMLYLSNGGWAPIRKSDIPAAEFPSFEDLLRRKIDKTMVTRST